MAKHIKDIIEGLNLNTLGQNLASQQSFGIEAAANENKVLKYEEYEDFVIELIAAIYSDLRSRHAVERNLKQIKSCFQIDVPMNARPTLFRQLNSLMGSLMPVYLHDQSMYNLCFEVMTIFKNHIDRREQNEDSLNEMEWDELQKAIYLFCDWEDSFLVSSSSQSPVDTL